MSAPINIGPKQRRVRRIVGLVGGLVAIAGALWVVLRPVHALWAAALTLPAFVAALGLLQASAGT